MEQREKGYRLYKSWQIIAGCLSLTVLVALGTATFNEDDNSPYAEVHEMLKASTAESVGLETTSETKLPRSREVPASASRQRHLLAAEGTERASCFVL